MLPANPLLHATAPAGPHLPVALLRQYAAGTLAPAAQHRVEAHTLACPRCADILEGLLQTPPATTDQALAQLQQRLRQRVQQPSAAAIRPLPRTASQHRWLAPQLAAAVTLLLGLVAGGWWAWQQRHPAAAGTHMATAKTDVFATTPASAAPPTPVPSPAAAPPVLASTPSATATKPSRATHHARSGQRPSLLAYNQHISALSVDSSTARVKPPLAAAPPPAARATPDAAVKTLPADTTQTAGRPAPAAANVTALPAPARVRDSAMPAGPAIAPAPAGGYAALREKLRQQATEFVPEAPERPLSGTVQLRLLIGPDGKIQQINVVRGLRADYDAEAQRLVCEGPAWVPGISGGRRAAQAVSIAVPF